MTSPFERYRSNTLPFSIPRIIAGTVLTVLVWAAITFLSGSALAVLRDKQILHRPQDLELWTMLAGFAGIWLGLWLAMHYLHGEPLNKLYGSNQRLDRQGVARGFLAIVIAAVVAELTLAVTGISTFTWSDWSWLPWLAILPVLIVLTWIQTSAEELLFRAYLMRGIASRKRSAWAWVGIPAALFVLLHIEPGMTMNLAAVEIIGIASITAILVFTVVHTGNLGAAMGVHFGNNLFIFAGISHEPSFNANSLANGTPTPEMISTPAGVAAIILITIASTTLAALLLTDPRSPLCLRADTA